MLCSLVGAIQQPLDMDPSEYPYLNVKTQWRIFNYLWKKYECRTHSLTTNSIFLMSSPQLVVLFLSLGSIGWICHVKSRCAWMSQKQTYLCSWSWHIKYICKVANRCQSLNIKDDVTTLNKAKHVVRHICHRLTNLINQK